MYIHVCIKEKNKKNYHFIIFNNNILTIETLASIKIPRAEGQGYNDLIHTWR